MMGDPPSSPGSAVSPLRNTAKSNRPDLEAKYFGELDLKKLDEYRSVLVSEKLFVDGGEMNITPSMVEVDEPPFTQGTMSCVLRGRIGGQWFAIKRSWISIVDVYNIYEKEIKSLQALSESRSWHIIQLIGHYIEPANEGNLVLSPLAECTLKDYLSQPPTLRCKLVVMRWFGCLAGALQSIHEQNIKHKDIKTENILVHGDNIIITDLGISNKFTVSSTSFGESLGSIMYMAPEVHDGSRRGRQQDVWSLICCFIEMYSFIVGYTISDFRKLCNLSEWSFRFNDGHDRVIVWLNHLKSLTKEQAHLALLDLLLTGFKKNQEERPTASELFDRLRDMGMFVGECCAIPRSHSRSGSEKFSLSLSMDPQLLQSGSLPHFLVGAGRRITSRLLLPSIRASMDELLQEAELEHVRSLRSAEREVMFYIAPVRPFIDFVDHPLLIYL
jgi:serine/threonine protein kinase